MIVEWKDEYSVGLEEIDSHHKRLIELLNKSYLMVLQDDKHPELSKLLFELLAYAKYHFAAEEELMREYQYEKMEQHELAHLSFINKVVTYKKDLGTGMKYLSVEIFDFIRSWLLDHILKIDAEMGKSIRSKQRP